MKIPMFRITISWDDETEVFIPEFQETEVSQKLNTHEKVDIINQGVNVVLKAIGSTPDKNN